MAQPQNINDAMERLIRVGPVEAMREDEVAAGFTPVLPGEVTWLSATDWPGDVVISHNNKQVRIVAIKAKVRGQGSFRRLIEAITAAGMTPIVVEPMFAMPDILKKWGWARQTIGSGFQTEEQWHPPLSE